MKNIYNAILSSLVLDNYNPIMLKEQIEKALKMIHRGSLLTSSEHIFVENIFKELRSNRQFFHIISIYEGLAETENLNSKYFRYYIQSIIDIGMPNIASILLNKIIANNDKLPEGVNSELHGLGCRIKKQLCIDNMKQLNSINENLLIAAINEYYQGYLQFNHSIWLGINVVTLGHLAKRNEITINSDINLDGIAISIIEGIEKEIKDDTDSNVDIWSYATIIEAYLSLDNKDKIAHYLELYLNDPKLTDFVLNSFIRQLEEVWEITVESEHGINLLVLLKAKKIEVGGDFETNISKSDITFLSSISDSVDLNYEKVFGNVGFTTMKTYLRGLSSCYSIGKVSHVDDYDIGKGIGTGFIIRGEHLHEELGKTFFFVTNAHVISDLPLKNKNSFRPEEAVVIFDMDEDKNPLYFDSILYSSSIESLDVTVLKFKEKSHSYIIKYLEKNGIYKKKEIFPSAAVPNIESRINIIGHPLGNDLQLSINDNKLLDKDNSKMHYRTPTEGGNSGSPIFNSSWKLIGVHHAGQKKLRKLTGNGVHDANEGIMWNAIRRDYN